MKDLSHSYFSATKISLILKTWSRPRWVLNIFLLCICFLIIFTVLTNVTS